MKGSYFLFLLIMIGFNLVFLQIVGSLGFIDNIILDSTIDQFSSSLNESLGLVLFLRIIWLIMNLWFIWMMRSDPTSGRILKAYLMFILIFDVLIPFYSSIRNPSLYLGKVILSSRKEKFSGIKNRIYLYHYYKKSNNIEGISLVVNKGLENVSSQDMDYIIEHRKDKEIKNFINPQLKEIDGGI